MLEPVDVNVYENDELKHWGILGMHWGAHHYQNEDKTLIPEEHIQYDQKDIVDFVNKYLNDNCRKFN